jgi:hypothetical protein
MVEVEMNQTTKLLLAMSQVEGILKLIHHNEYEQYFISHLIPIRTELNRQLTNAKQCTTMKE